MADGPRDASHRKQFGVHYTPDALVRAIVAEAVFPGAGSAVDPACGDGRFLIASGLPETIGVDLDPAAPGLVRDDALKRDWGGATFDVVLGNPPFLNQMARATTRGGRSSFGGGPYANAAAEFLALALRLARPGGRIGMVLPQSLLAARDAAPIRRLVDEHAALRWMWWSPTRMFDASVRVWAGVWEVGATQREVRRSYGPDFAPIDTIDRPATWSGLITDHAVGSANEGPSLGSIATFRQNFRDQYYGLVGVVGDDVDGPPLITSGLIDPGVCHWGRRPVRFAKQRYEAPRVDLDRLDDRMRRWADERLVPKILIANQTRVIEAVHDRDGAWLPSVPVVTCFTDKPDRVLHVLASDTANRWVHHHHAGSGLSAGTVRLSPDLLASIPLNG
jgi:SAM-dependent methyltransferase